MVYMWEILLALLILVLLVLGLLWYNGNFDSMLQTTNQQQGQQQGQQQVQQQGQQQVQHEQPVIKPRTSKISDCGYPQRTRGWYDMQNQGQKNDYCRWVGNPPNTWFSCQLAGSDNPISPKSVLYNENDPHDPFIPGTYGC